MGDKLDEIIFKNLCKWSLEGNEYTKVIPYELIDKISDNAHF